MNLLRVITRVSLIFAIFLISENSKASLAYDQAYFAISNNAALAENLKVIGFESVEEAAIAFEQGQSNAKIETGGVGTLAICGMPRFVIGGKMLCTTLFNAYSVSLAQSNLGSGIGIHAIYFRISDKATKLKGDKACFIGGSVGFAYGLGGSGGMLLQVDCDNLNKILPGGFFAALGLDYGLMVIPVSFDVATVRLIKKY